MARENVIDLETGSQLDRIVIPVFVFLMMQFQAVGCIIECESLPYCMSKVMTEYTLE